MRLTRPRFKVRQIMIVVAVVAAILALEKSMYGYAIYASSYGEADDRRGEVFATWVGYNAAAFWIILMGYLFWRIKRGGDST